MANFQDIAQQFVDFYYKTFDGDRTQLMALYVRGERERRAEKAMAADIRAETQLDVDI